MLMITFIIAVVITLLLILNTQLIHIIPDIEDSRVTTSILESKRFYFGLMAAKNAIKSTG